MLSYYREPSNVELLIDANKFGFALESIIGDPVNLQVVEQLILKNFYKSSVHADVLHLLMFSICFC